MRKKKKAFTIVEMLFAGMVLSMIFAAGISQILLVSGTLYAGQTETTNRSDFNEIVYYLTREIQSAEGIRICEDGKKLEIKEAGRDDYNLVYAFENDYPTDYLMFKDKKMIDVEYDQSKFEFDGDSVKITFAVVKNSVDVNQRPELMTVTVTPRTIGITEDI